MSKLIPPKNVLLLGGVLVLGIAARYHGERTYSSAANFMSRTQHDMDDAETWLVICLLGLAGSLAGAALGYRLNRVTAAIMGLVGGAVATAHYSSIVGGFLAVPMSLLVTCVGPRRMAVVTVAGVAAAIAGVGGGYAAGAISIGPVEPMTLLATLLLVVMVVVAGNVGLAKWRPAAAEEKRWRRIAGRSTLATITLIAAVGGVPLGITFESIVWLRNAGCGGWNRSPRPLDAASFKRGFCNLHGWRTTDAFHESDLRKLRRFDGIDDLRLRGAEIGDQSLTLIGAWPGLWNLDLSKTRVTDEGVSALAVARFLRYLDLSGTRVAGGSFSRLPRGLVSLRLADTSVTDAALAKLATLPLNGLTLENTAIGDAGVANLRGLVRLSHLDLSGTRITDAALATLVKNHAWLDRLDLRNTKTTRAGLAHLAKLPSLRWLELCNCSIGDDAIDELVRCKSLAIVNLRGTKVTPQGVARLREAFPDCWIECDFPDR